MIEGMVIDMNDKHYLMKDIQRRHFNETAARCGLGETAEPFIKEISEVVSSVACPNAMFKAVAIQRSRHKLPDRVQEPVRFANVGLAFLESVYWASTGVILALLFQTRDAAIVMKDE